MRSAGSGRGGKMTGVEREESKERTRTAIGRKGEVFREI